MKRPALGLLLVLLLTLCVSARENYELRADVKEAQAAMEAGKYIRARELAEAMLKQDSNNWAAAAILGHLYLYVEPGGLPRAQYYLEKARGQMRRAYGEPPDESGPYRTHWQILVDLITTAGHMDRYHDQLRLLDDYDRMYKPMPEERGWTLMKLGRISEARRLMLGVLETSKEERPREVALNTLGALESESGNLRKSRDYKLQLLREIEQNGWTPECTFFRNLAELEAALGNYSRAEELLLESGKYPDAWAYTNPWGDLAELYLEQGRFPEVLSAIKRMEAWGATSVPIVVSQTWAERQTITATALLALGYDDVAEGLMRRIIYRPDRNMGTSAKAYLIEATSAAIYRNVLLCRRQRIKEEMSWCTWPRWFELAATLVNISQELDQVTDRTAAIVVANDGLEAGVQCSETGSFYQSWLLPDVNRVFGPGVVGAQVKLVMASSSHENLEVEKPFLNAVLAEGKFLNASRATARTALEAAIKDLAPAMVLLRARLEAELAQTIWGQGDEKQAMVHYANAYGLDGAVFRRLGMAIPADISSGGGSLAGKAAGYLRSSPRFFSSSSGFKVVVSEGATGLSAVVSDTHGTRLASVNSPTKNNPDETVRAFCARFHEFVFSARLDLSQSDINSLNGSTASTTAAREDLMKTLNMQPQPPTP